MEPKVKTYKTRTVWTDEDEDILVELWTLKVPDFRGPKKNSHIYREMAVDLRKQGLNLDGADVKTKLNNMTSKYKKECTMTDGPSTWRHFQSMQYIHGDTRKNSVSHSEQSVEIDNIKLENGGAEFILPSPIPSPPVTPHHAANREKSNFHKQLLTSINEFRQEFKDELHKLQQADAQLLALEKEKVSLLRKQVNDAAELKDGVLKLLAELGSNIKME